MPPTKRPKTNPKFVKKQTKKERSQGVSEHDAAAKWLKENDPMFKVSENRVGY